MNLTLMLENTVGRYADKAAIISRERRVSYAELEAASNKLANALIKMGVRKGDRLAMLMDNSPEFVTVFFGIVKAGGIAVPLDTRYKLDEFAAILGSCQPKILLAENQYLNPLARILSRFDSIEHVIDTDDGNEGRFLSYQELMASSSADRVNVDFSPDDLAVISYTSGPTTNPKGAIFSHELLCMEANISANGFKQTDKDVVMLFALPLYHNFGMASVLLTSINQGSTIVMVPGTGISISSLMEAIERERGTMLLGVPYIFALATKMARSEGVKNDLSSLRLCVSGGAPLTVSNIRQFKRYYGLTVIDIWGLTEAVSQVTCQPIDGSGKLGASGKALPGWEMKIVDDNDHELPPNQSGEIVVRGPIMKGYYNNPQATAEAIKNGWLHTGDIGKIDKDGYLYITGRKKFMIILKGQNIYPIDIEKVLRAYPKIAEAKIFGTPDKLRGEIVGAIIRLKRKVSATEQEIRYYCQERMADYKLPRQIVFTQSLIKNVTARFTQNSFKGYLPKLPSLPSMPAPRRILKKSRATLSAKVRQGTLRRLHNRRNEIKP